MKKFAAIISSVLVLTVGSQLGAQNFVPRAPSSGQNGGTSNYDAAAIIGVGAAIAAIILLTHHHGQDGHSGHN